ncbi:EAL domain-containing protein [Pseudacidovorax intermedius]|mgnify:CR=1 FL=1|uniref:EAL domain-containing protein n=1 Tax=Pseudacidovorax intermedius TaxID=433924 RepID=UPI0026EF3993|nr:EAL domain-containing protein [Pseudacidovorax intermedius]
MKSEVRSKLEAPVDLGRARHHVTLLAVAAIACTAVLLQFPWPWPLLGAWVDVLHLLLEFAGVATAAHVISIAWSGLSNRTSVEANALILCFTLVAGVGLVHALRHDIVHSPEKITDSATTSWLWLIGAVVQLVAIGLLIFRVQLLGPRSAWLQLAVACVALLAWTAARVNISGVPPAMDDGFALLVTAGFCIACFALYHRFKQDSEVADLWLALSCFLAGLSTLSFGFTLASGKTADLTVDFLRLSSYACLHRAVFITGFQSPIRRLLLSEARLRERENELQNILESLPAGMCRLDGNLKLRYSNRNFKLMMGLEHKSIGGLPVDEMLAPDRLPVLRPHLHQAMAGKKVAFDFAIETAPGEPVHHRHVVLAPARESDGMLNGVLAIVSDVTDRETALIQAAETAQEILELKAALDAHAIVAITDAKGFITRVNDKFCSISKYAREELVGKTHRIINSGYHPKGFFGDMWKTISRGEVWNGEVCNRAKDGSLYWVHTTIVPLLGPTGNPEQYIAIRADITMRKEAEAEAQRMALHDALTGLPNRRLMGDRLTHALHTAQGERQHGALLVLDMDNFKDVNDSLGHAVGDLLLRQVAIRLTECVRKGDTVARLGGDEFLVILEHLDPNFPEATSQALDIGSQIREALCEPFHFGTQVISTSPSIGVILFGEGSPAPDELVKRADMALYKAKEEGRNRLAFFDPQLQEEINARTELLRELRNAITKSEFTLYYQPVVDTAMKIVSVEALIRWKSERLGLVSPGQFIPLAEQSNLILPIGQWVLHTACTQLKAWEQDPARRHWTIAVNVSAKQFYDDGFVSNVLQTLEVTGAPANKLRFEITESMMQVNLRETTVKMQTLRSLGVLFSLDDFGTGYSSLSYLKTLPLDQLKIDRSFVDDILTDPNDAAIIRTILALADHLSLSVVAEGVETVEQKQLLMSYGCRTYQGFLFGKPVPVELLGSEIDAVHEAQAIVQKVRSEHPLH